MLRSLAVAVFLLCAGCATYRTPGAGASLEALGRPGAVEDAARRPSPQFPVGIAVVRIQAPRYSSYSAKAYGNGPFSVLAEGPATAALLREISGWPSVKSAAAFGIGLLPQRLSSLEDLRLAAAKAQIDVLLIYTVDTSLRTPDRAYDPGASVPLDAQGASFAVRASAIFSDVRTGFTYGTDEAVVSGEASDARNSREHLEARRLEVEQQAVEQLASNVGQTWAGIVQHYR